MSAKASVSSFHSPTFMRSLSHSSHHAFLNGQSGSGASPGTLNPVPVQLTRCRQTKAGLTRPCSPQSTLESLFSSDICALAAQPCISSLLNGFLIRSRRHLRSGLRFYLILSYKTSAGPLTPRATKRSIVDIPTMALKHGLVKAFGFVASSLLLRVWLRKALRRDRTLALFFRQISSSLEVVVYIQTG